MERQSDECKWNACQLEYLNAVLAMGDPAALVAALAAVARAKGKLRMAEGAGLGRLGMYKALSGSGTLAFATVVGVAAELGYSFSMHAVQAGDAPFRTQITARVTRVDDPRARGRSAGHKHPFH